MPWKHVEPMDEKRHFIQMVESGLYTMSEVCHRHLISRKTGYKWYNRYLSRGFGGLKEASRAPHSCPHRTPAQIEKLLIDKRKQTNWGPRKIRDYFVLERPDLAMPAESTIGDILRRAGLVKSRKRRHRSPHPTAPPLQADLCNQVWTMDFKGEFRLLNGAYCYPLTIEDAHSRFLICCHGLNSTAGRGVRPVLECAFSEYGLPEAIRTDNGAPFASSGRLGLSRLAVFCLKLDIAWHRIAPASPWQNGRHERMHRTLKEEATIPPEADMQAQQRRFDRFRQAYNTDRPHQSLGGKRPASRYQPSSRRMPNRIEQPRYPSHFEVRKVSAGGRIKFKNRTPFISETLAKEFVGLEEIECGIWSVNFYQTELGRFNETDLVII